MKVLLYFGFILILVSCIKKNSYESINISLNSITIKEYEYLAPQKRYLYYNISIFNNSKRNLRLDSIFTNRDYRIYGGLVTIQLDSVILTSGFNKESIIKPLDSVIISLHDTRPVLKRLDAINNISELDNLVLTVFKDSKIYLNYLNPNITKKYIKRDIHIYNTCKIQY